ncbi:MAG: phosphatidate cytidylyltransferase [Gammaproteobacteria bacterium]|nr:phosphatidate cytidylyltransferase [Gammaproteobacteria bacterium]
MKQRIITAVFALVGVFALLFLLPPIVTRLALAALLLLGAWEWSGFLSSRSPQGRWTFVALVALLLLAVGTVLAPYQPTLLLIALVWWMLALVWTFFFPTPIPVWLRWLAGLLVLVPLYAALMQLFILDPKLLLFALLVVWVADIGAYFAGRFLGRVKLAPKISPGKTWEGAIGGLLAVLLLTLLSGSWLPIALPILLPFVLAVACLSIVGDLTVSMFKRSAGLKDSGTLFPGHGGVLDRIDSVSAAAPLFALGLTWMGLS